MATFRAHLIFIILLCITAFLLSVFSFADDALIGSIAPPFKAVSGDQKTLTLDDLKGKVAVLFYEPKSLIEQNRRLKAVLNDFYAKEPDEIKKEIARIAVIDCRGVWFRGAWESGLRDNSLKEGITVYGDWDGKMAADYHISEGQSNVLIVDKKGLIRYHASGRVEDKDIGAIEELLKSLISQA